MMFAHIRRHHFPVHLLALGMYCGLLRFHRGPGRPFGPGGPWGPGGGLWPGFKPAFGGRRFRRGDLKYVILDLLREGPRHGYDIIRAIEERFHGLYTPSAGSVYPTLQLLEDQGYVTSREQDGKKVYSITDEGRAFLEERAETVDDVRSRMAHDWGQRLGPEIRDLMQEAAHVVQTVAAQGASGGFKDPEKIRRLREVLARTRQEIEAIFRGESGETKL